MQDGMEVWDHDNVKLEHEGQILQIHRAKIENKGTYSCKASNKAGVDSRSFNLQFKGSTHD